MKKKLGVKLMLRKETLSNLTNAQMNSLRGRGATYDSICPLVTRECQGPATRNGSWCICE